MFRTVSFALLIALGACAHNEGPPPALLTGESMPPLITEGREIPAVAGEPRVAAIAAEPVAAAPVAVAPLPSEEPAAQTDAGHVAYAGALGVIRRRELMSVLNRSPAVFLRSIESEPQIEARRFRGWRIVAFYPGDARFSGIDLRSGDVVTRINGRTIEQPDHFFGVWEALKEARELRVDLLRNGQPHVARWEIVD